MRSTDGCDVCILHVADVVHPQGPVDGVPGVGEHIRIVATAEGGIDPVVAARVGQGDVACGGRDVRGEVAAAAVEDAVRRTHALDVDDVVRRAGIHVQRPATEAGILDVHATGVEERRAGDRVRRNRHVLGGCIRDAVDDELITCIATEIGFDVRTQEAGRATGGQAVRVDDDAVRTAKAVEDDLVHRAGCNADGVHTVAEDEVVRDVRVGRNREGVVTCSTIDGERDH